MGASPSIQQLDGGGGEIEIGGAIDGEIENEDKSYEEEQCEHSLELEKHENNQKCNSCYKDKLELFSCVKCKYLFSMCTNCYCFTEL